MEANKNKSTHWILCGKLILTRFVIEFNSSTIFCKWPQIKVNETLGNFNHNKICWGQAG